eukprot:snap_masked-scaffold1057_size73593-processed-gene-0.5 protein:Tk01338 transcript:snap_masked-scaffold1057_size73593-processed-gene-0.5-mRNA-1 annotation:"Prestin"
MSRKDVSLARGDALEAPLAETDDEDEGKESFSLQVEPTVDPAKAQCEHPMDLSSDEEPLKAEVKVDRKAYNQVMFNERFQFELPTRKKGLKDALCTKIPQAATCLNMWKILIGLFPILEWLPNYRWREDFVYDVAGGFTVAVMHIPQGMAYGILAAVDPIVGIYSAFFPILIYIIMGTSRHASFGTFALISILVSSPVQKYSSHDVDGDSRSENYSQVEVLAAVSFTVGFIQVLCSIFQMGQFCSLLSDALISGFTTGTAFFVFTSQLEHILGIDLPKFFGPFNLIKFYRALAFQIHETNLITLSLSLACISLLLLYDLGLKKHVKRCLNGIEFPIQLVCVIITILISYFCNLHEDFDVKVIGHVPTGLPSPVRLPVRLIPKVAVDSAMIAIVGFVISFSLGRLFAKKHDYKVCPSQELVAQGCSSMFGAFFNSLPIAASLSRSAIQEESGCRTLMATAVSCFALLWVLLFAGPLFQPLPKAVLSAIIVVALRSMFLKVTEVVSFARKSTFDGLIWLLAFFSTVILDVDYGLLVTFTANVLSVLHSSLTPTVQVLSETDYLDLNIDPDCYHDPRYLLLEMSGVSEMDPSAWSILNDVHKVLIKNNQALVIAGLQAELTGSSTSDMVRCSWDSHTDSWRAEVTATGVTTTPVNVVCATLSTADCAMLRSGIHVLMCTRARVKDVLYCRDASDD